MHHDLDAMLDEFDVSWMLACESAKSPRARSPPCYYAVSATLSIESDCPDLEVRASGPRLTSPASSLESTTKSLAYESSLKVFRRHIKTTVTPDGSVQVDSEGIVSRACYEDWLSTRPHSTSTPEQKFRRTLTCSVSGTDGRRPFSPLEEASVLEQLRMKRVWPAFVGSSFVIGSKGFRSYVS